MRATRLLGVCATGILIAGTVGVGTAWAEPTSCGARQNPLECVELSAPTPGEVDFINHLRGNVSGTDAQLQRAGRGTCIAVRQGEVTTNAMVQSISEYLRISEAAAGQVLNAAMASVCPGYTVIGNGTTKPADGSSSRSGSPVPTVPAPTVSPSYLAGQQSGHTTIEFLRSQGDSRTFSKQGARSECTSAATNLISVLSPSYGFVTYPGGRIPASQVDWDAFRNGCVQGILTTQ
ncbi:DUF732 domain-containing protein [Mycolicibacterium fortuitum]|uniref:DUF732 domain-containing protein n=1 Tax=Mycolicibacterium fortuitum TaxID=1766 RepID=UPI000ABDCF4D